MLLVFPFLHHLKEICSYYKISGSVLKVPEKYESLSGKLFTEEKPLRSSQPFKCCDQTFQYRSYFLNHAKTLKHQKNTCCETCSLQCTTTKDLVEHMEQVHGCIELNCEVCCATFVERHELERHVQLSHKEPLYHCNICSYKARSLNAVKNHQSLKHSTHETEKCMAIKQEQLSGPFECCGKTFKYLSHYERHQTSLRHFDQSRCGICYEVFQSVKALEQHRKDLHYFTGSKWACPICGKTCSTNGTLSTHLREIHLKSTVFECAKCEFTGTDKYSLSRHVMSKHTPDHAVPKHLCHVCHRYFRRKDTLTNHLKTHDPNFKRAFKCSKCEYSSHAQAFIRQHFVRKHSLEPKQYGCSTCSRWFHTKDQLKRHSRLHEKYGSAHHYCNLCKYSCSSVENLEEHKKLHRPCQVCGVVIVAGGRKKKEQHIRSHLNLGKCK